MAIRAIPRSLSPQTRNAGLRLFLCVVIAMPMQLVLLTLDNRASACYVGDTTATEAPSSCSTCPKPLFCIASPPDSGESMTKTGSPINLLRGAAVEQVTDLSVPGLAGGWSLTRSYDSSFEYISGGYPDSPQGYQWCYSGNSIYLTPDGDDVTLYTSASTKRSFTYYNSTTFDAPVDYRATLTIKNKGTAAEHYRLVELDTQQVFVFYGLNTTAINSHLQGKLHQVTTLQLEQQGIAPTEYLYDTADGNLLTVTTYDADTINPNQAYKATFTYIDSTQTPTEAGRLDLVEVEDSNGQAIAKVEYTYFGEVGAYSDYGYYGDLIQVKVWKLASDGTSWIKRATQYRHYNGGPNGGGITHVFEPDAIERVMEAGSYSSPEDLFLIYNTTLVGGHSLANYASRRFEYNSGTVATSSVTTDWETSEDLETKYGEYGGSNLDETGLVSQEVVGPGCSCGGSGPGLTYNYYHMNLNGGSSTDPTVVIRLVVEDAVDADGTAVHRRIWGLNCRGVTLREVLLDSVGTGQKAWCYSTIVDSSHRVVSKRMPSAHATVDTDAEIKEFLNPTGDSGQNDTDTVSDSAGVVHYYEYDTSYGDGYHRTGTRVGNGDVGVANASYVSATDWGDATSDVADEQPWLPTAKYVYPKQTSARNDTYRIKTSEYTYAYWDDDADSNWDDGEQLKQITTTLPVIASGSNGQNGSGVATKTEQYFDTYGRLRWTMDGDGYVNYYSYDPETGRRSYSVIDIDPASPGSEVTSGDNSGTSSADVVWDDWTVGDADDNYPIRGASADALALDSISYFDVLGRQVLTRTPDGSYHAVAYDTNLAIQFPYWNGSAAGLPLQVNETDDGGTTTRTYQLGLDNPTFTIATATVTGAPVNLPTKFSTAPATSDYVSLTEFTHNELSGLLESVDRYYDITSSEAYTTTYLYDATGRRGATVQYVDTNKYQINVQQYDNLGRVIANKMSVETSVPAGYAAALAAATTISQLEYDSGGVGDSRVTSSKQYYSDTGDYIESIPKYTFRGDVRGVERNNNGTAFGPYQVRDLDWMGRTISSATYATAPTTSWPENYDNYVTTNSNGVPGNLITSKSPTNATITFYDKLGRVYRTEQFPGIESIKHFQIDSYYDARGNLVASGDKYGAHQEMAYDGAGRQYQTRTVSDLQSPIYNSTTHAFSYAAPTPDPHWKADGSGLNTNDVVAGAMEGGDQGVIEFTHTVFDDSGNAIQQHSFEMTNQVHVDNGGGANADGLSLSASNSSYDYIRRSVYSWYENDRIVCTADFGAGDGDSSDNCWMLSDVPAYDTEPAVSTAYMLLTKYTYNPLTKRPETVKVWKDSATTTTTKTFYDDLGRREFVAENWFDFSPPSTGIGDSSSKDRDRVTGWEYNGLGKVTNLKAYNGSSSYVQETEYKYQNSYNATLPTLIKYPDGNTDTTGTDQDNIQLSYNLDGSLVSRKDQQQTTITYRYDPARRVVFEDVTSIDTAKVDDAVLSIGRVYDPYSRLLKTTSYDGTASGSGTSWSNANTKLNEVGYVYADSGYIVSSQQSHSGPNNAQTTPTFLSVSDQSADSEHIYTNALRPQIEIYPGSHVNYFGYGNDGSIGDRLSRVASIADNTPANSGTELTSYQYNGSNRLVETKYAVPDVHQHADRNQDLEYRVWDRFGRTIQAYWRGATNGFYKDQFYYAYDYAGNRVARHSSLSSGWSQDYDYDDLNRLKDADQGSASSSTPYTVSSKTLEQRWSLDQMGNWSSFWQDNNANGDFSEPDDLLQDRAHNDVNEIDDDNNHDNVALDTITASGSEQSDWVDPQYDASGNLTFIPKPKGLENGYTAKYDAWNRLVSLDSGTSASYKYDGLHRRIVRTEGATTTHFYYNNKWQCVEERLSATSSPTKRYIWHPHYIDSLAVSYTDLDANGVLTGAREGTHYYLHDANYNVTGVLDSSGNVVERYHYSPYGEVTILNGAVDADSSVSDWSEDTNGSDIGNEFLYTGRRLDPETGLYQYRFRYYHPQLGRFVNRDPIGHRGGMNLYEYVNGAPVGLLDPFGLKKKKIDPIVIPDETLCGTFVWSDYKLDGSPGWSVDFDPKGCKCNGTIKLVQVIKWDGFGEHAHFDIKKPTKEFLPNNQGRSWFERTNNVLNRTFPGYCESGQTQKSKKESAYSPLVDYSIHDAPAARLDKDGFEYEINICAVCVDKDTKKEEPLGCINFRWEVGKNEGFYLYNGGKYSKDDDGNYVMPSGNNMRFPSAQPNSQVTEACRCWENWNDRYKGSKKWYKDKLRRIDVEFK